MSAVLAAVPMQVPDTPAMWARGLDSDGGSWTPDFEAWAPAQAQRWRSVLVRSADGKVVLLADRPEDAMLLQRLEATLSRSVQWAMCDAAALEGLLALGAARFRALDAIEPGPDAGAGHSEAQELSALHLAEQSSPVLRLLDSTLYDALHDGASDLHFECTQRGMAIRCRIDGVMLPVQQVDGSAVAEQLVSRLKVMAELDVGERRLPQDGRFKLRIDAREVDFRLSIMPTVFGEDAVVRLLDRAGMERDRGRLTLESLGFDARTAHTVRTLASQPHGMLLVTGPTGSGKTTTLYAAMTETYNGRDKVVTIEDPVEYQLPGVVQIPVNEKKGLSFARGLRSVLRHDPDRVMVGEIRDAETAQIAVQAALTGHLVFSTVHANSAFDVMGRFMHMGLDMYNVVSALNAVLAQRLVRVNCSACKAPARPTRALLERFGLDAAEGTAHTFSRGAGCAHCRHTGFKGRRALSELLLLDDELRDLIASRAPLVALKEAARQRGMQSLRAAALAAVCRGETTFEEVERVTLEA